jgi:sulfur relay protein TusB/DsrH
MTTLHIIRTSMRSHQASTQALEHVQTADGILLLDDAAYNVTDTIFQQALVASNIPEITLYCCHEHLDARGVDLSNSALQITIIELAQLPSIFFHYQNSITWQ